MEMKPNTMQYRERLDKTLSSPDLTNVEMLEALVKNQLYRSSEPEIEEYKENVVESRTVEVSKFLDMLRSASVDDSKRSNSSHADWKLKQDTKDFRVMYREGPEGTPFHTLLVEGYVDGPVDVCLCISWETTLFKKWWPQTSAPTFKILQSECLKKIQMGEQISLMRVKVSWPLSTREAVMHYYLFEYFKDDLIIVLINTVPESKSINGTLNAFKNEEIPEAKDVVRIDMMGGFALQKVTSERSYFRTISNMDIKLDFVPPSLINFISRQLTGSGFRLYKKAVASMMSHDEEFIKALGNPLYARIREALYDNLISERAKNEELKQSANILSGKDRTKSNQDEAEVVSADNSTPNNAIGPDNSKQISEIEELDCEETAHSKEEGMKGNNMHIPMGKVETRSLLKNNKRNVYISPEVEQAIDTLEKAISIVRNQKIQSQRPFYGFINEEFPRPTKKCSKSEVSIEVSNQDVVEGRTIKESPGTDSVILNSRPTETDVTKEVNYNKVVPTSPEQNVSGPNEENQVALCCMENGETSMETAVNVIQDISSDEARKTSRKGKFKYCCFLPQLEFGKKLSG